MEAMAATDMVGIEAVGDAATADVIGFGDDANQEIWEPVKIGTFRGAAFVCGCIATGASHGAHFGGPISAGVGDILGGSLGAYTVLAGKVSFRPKHFPDAKVQEQLARVRQELEAVKDEAATVPPQLVADTEGAVANSNWQSRLLLLEAELARLKQEEAKVKAEWPIPNGVNIEKINFAITGETKAGKSSFINRLLGEKVAGTGANQKTMESKAYEFKLAHGFVWDLPGAGTREFPLGVYVKQMGLRWFDGLIIVVKDSWSEADDALFREAKGYGVPVYIVRSKMDVTIDSDNYDHGMEPMDSVMEVRKELERLVGKEYSERIFLVSARPGAYPEVLQAEYAKFIALVVEEFSKRRNVLPLVEAGTGDAQTIGVPSPEQDKPEVVSRWANLSLHKEFAGFGAETCWDGVDTWVDGASKCGIAFNFFCKCSGNARTMVYTLDFDVVKAIEDNCGLTDPDVKATAHLKLFAKGMRELQDQQLCDESPVNWVLGFAIDKDKVLTRRSCANYWTHGKREIKDVHYVELYIGLLKLADRGYADMRRD